MTTNRRRGLRALVIATALAGLVAVLGLTGLGSTLARWGDTAAQPGGSITDGNLDLVDQAAVTWVETTPGVASPRSGTGLTGSSGLDGFLGAPGDTVEVRYRVRSVLSGDNISAVVRATAVTTPTGVTTGGFRVLSTAGAVLAPAAGYQAMGTTTPVGALTVAGDTELLIAVKLTYTAALTYTSDLAGASRTPTRSVALRFSLEQVRTGAGFVS